MLFVFGFLLLLTPFPSLETSVDEREDATKNMTKVGESVNPMKPKITASASRLDPKSNPVNQTMLSVAAANPKPQRVDAGGDAKSRLRPTTTQSATVTTTVQSRAMSNKAKHLVTVNHSPPSRTNLTHETLPRKEEPSPTKAATFQSTHAKFPLNHSLGHTNHKPQKTADQSILRDRLSFSHRGARKDDPAENTLSASTKLLSSHAAKQTKHKPQHMVNRTNQMDPLSPRQGGNSKSKSVENPHSANANSRLADATGVTKHKVKQSGNHKPKIESQTTNQKKTSKNESVQNTHSVSNEPILDHAANSTKLKPKGTNNNKAVAESPSSNHRKTVNDKSTVNVPSTHVTTSINDTKTTKLIPKVSVNSSLSNNPLPKSTRTTAPGVPAPEKRGHARHSEDETSNQTAPTTVTATENEKLVSLKPVTVVICKDCDSNGHNEQGVKMTTSDPVVVTHQISLLPSGCSEGHRAEMDTLKGRVAQLEREMSFLKEMCPCSASCPNDCSGNGRCEKGRCLCQQGFTGQDCSKCKQGAECGKVDEAKKGTESVHIKPGKESISATKSFSREQPEMQEDPQRKSNTSTKNVSQLDTLSNSDHLKDEPQMNVTENVAKKTSNNSTKVGTKSHERSIADNKDGEQSSRQKKTKTPSSPKKKDTSPDDTKKIHKPGKEEATVTTPSTKDSRNKTMTHDFKEPIKKIGGLGSVKVENISSYSFTVAWLAPHGMFKNFTLTRRELHADLSKKSAAGNETEAKSEITNMSSEKVGGSKSHAETKTISVVVPSRIRSRKISHLQPNTRYVVQVYGTTENRRSKIHRVTATTGPEPLTQIFFSNVTESSVAVSWTRPKTIFTGFKVSYINIVSGESHTLSLSSGQSHVVLSKLSAGTSYIVSVTITKGVAQSEEFTSIITTVPAPPIHLQVVNVTHNRAVLRWTPDLGKVDRFIISYESSKTPNVTVTVMLSGTSMEHQLRGLQKNTVYTIKIFSQKDSLKSMAISTTFTTANVVKPSEIGARSAVIAWRSPDAYHSYRLMYEVQGKDAKEMILEPTATKAKLTGLLPMSRYTVVVQGEKKGHYTSIATSEFVTEKLRFPFPADCSQELLNGFLESGEVDIYPGGKEGEAVRVYCDMEVDGGGWTVFQRRMNGETDFYKTWNEYSAGFGNLTGEFWLGNKLLHNLTNAWPVNLRVDLRAGNETAFAHYTNFSVASEEKNYTLTVSGYSGTAGDSLKYHSGRPFSTHDEIHDRTEIHCAKSYMGGWWYKNCYKANLNGLYGTRTNNQGIVWIDWKGKDFSVPFTEMKFRPSSFPPTPLH